MLIVLTRICCCINRYNVLFLGGMRVLHGIEHPLSPISYIHGIHRVDDGVRPFFHGPEAIYCCYGYHKQENQETDGFCGRKWMDCQKITNTLTWWQFNEWYSRIVLCIYSLWCIQRLRNSRFYHFLPLPYVSFLPRVLHNEYRPLDLTSQETQDRVMPHKWTH